MFDKLIWKNDRVLLGELVFRLELSKRDDWELGRECFAFYKTKPLCGRAPASGAHETDAKGMPSRPFQGG